MRSRGLACWLALAWLASVPAFAQERTQAPAPGRADLILRNGAIYTMDGARPRVASVAVRGGVYVALGDDREVAAWEGPGTTIVDLHGAMAMPGINDVHQHPLDGGYERLYACRIGPSMAFEALLDAVRGCARRSEPGDWIVGGAWGSQHLERLARPESLLALDAASAGHPVFLRDDTFHNRWVNSAALRQADIDQQSASPAGGEIVKDPASGRPTGLLKEFSAFRAIEARIPARPAQRLARAAAEAIRFDNSLGITGIQDAYSNESDLKVWCDLDRNAGLSAWMVASLAQMPSPDPTLRYGEALIAVRDQYRTSHVQPDFAKLFLDGVPPARTAVFLEPYLADPAHDSGFRGSAKYSQEQLTEALVRLDRLGIPVKMHATGDGSVRMALDAVAAVRRRNGPGGPQHQIAHASFIAPEDIPRFRALNVAADVSPMLWFPTGLWLATVGVIGPERAGRFWPIRQLLASGALVAGGSDWPAGQDTPNPWIGIEGMVTRRNPGGEVPGVLWAEQAIGLPEAVRTYTIDSARAMGIAAQTGSVALGKSADLIVLDRRIFEIPIEQVHETQVLRTFFQGRSVYER